MKIQCISIWEIKFSIFCFRNTQIATLIAKCHKSSCLTHLLHTIEFSAACIWCSLNWLDFISICSCCLLILETQIMPTAILMCLVNKRRCFWHVNLSCKLHVSDLLLFALIWVKVVMLCEIFKRIFIYSSSVFIPEDKSLECVASYVWFLSWGGCFSLVTSVLQGLDEEQSVQLLQCYLQEDYRGTRNSLKVCGCVQIPSLACILFLVGFRHFRVWVPVLCHRGRWSDTLSKGF